MRKRRFFVMTKKKTLLEEGTVRQFMKLANLRPLTNPFVERLYESDQEELTEEEEELVEVDLGEEYLPEEEELEVGAEAELDVPGEEGGEEELEVGGEEELEVGGEEEAEVSITPEEAEVLIGLGNKLSTEVAELGGEEELPAPEEELPAPEEELPAPEGEEEVELGAEEEEVLEEDFDEMIATIAENVTQRIRKLSSQQNDPKRKLRNRK
jgi:hypothetical protein